MSYAERLTNMGLLPLELRREISDILLLFKFRNGLMTIDTSKYFNTYDSHYKTRNLI